MTTFLCLLLWLVGITEAQKLVVIIAEGLSGAHFHRFSHLSGLRLFEEEGVWSTRLFPVFPTLPLPNRHTLLTGVLPRKHGMMSDFVYNWRTGQEFLNFTQESDYRKSEWWMTDPIYVTATGAKASVAMFFFPECNVDWVPAPHLCVPPRKDGMSFADERIAKIVVEATKSHDLVLVYHPNIREQIANIGPRRSNDRTATEVDKFQQALERLTAQARERIDLNVMVISPHGLVDVPKRNIRVLDDYLPMELLQMSIGSGAVKQLIAVPGKTHQVYSQLRNHTPIPNVKVYFTTPKVGDLPEWYHYKKSSTVPDLVLVAQPGYAIVTRDLAKQIPPQNPNEIKAGMSGYNNHYPDMLGVFLAYGPVFRKGYHKGPLELCDIYTLMCSLLRIDDCNTSCGRILRIDDVLTSDTRVAVRAKLNRTNHAVLPRFAVAIIVIVMLL
ncbi:hypothetical protein Y032_0027g1564 [Ancylostoma ceylanicum]|uniref:glycerophosphocholine cholinephosphodiesterase n=1 Tax=Ancylostoma ceylanicum TaxID=53326 RepID=A0A016UUQ1_9BILA|nr:hypothetical protein Y032_0027g1564 [Ancylostoma ceylanicum]